MKRVLLFVCLFLLAGSVLAIEGVSPGSYEADFKNGLAEEFVFDFVLDEREDLVIEGDLAEYVSLDKDRVIGKESVVVSLNFPLDLDMVGVSNIWIVTGNVRGLIKVNFGYPDRYLDLEVAAPDVNVGEEVLINLKVSNFGVEALNVSPVVEVYFESEVVEVFEGESEVVKALENNDYEFSFGGVNYSAGEYVVRVFWDEFFGKDVFRLGELDLRILNYTSEVRKGSIREFNVEVESLFDDDMKEVFAEVRVIGRSDGEEVFLDRVDGFDTSIVQLGAWEKKNLTGYFNVGDLEGEVMLSIDVHYDGKVESEVVRVDILSRFDWWVFVLGFFVLALLGFFVSKFFRKK